MRFVALLPVLLLVAACGKSEAPVAATGTPTVHSAPPAPAPGTTFKDCPDCPEMVVIPAGSFFMGSPLDEAERGNDESPVHRVKITSPFALTKTEVTQKQWRAVMGGDPPELNFKGCGECPVERVSWDDAQEFLRKLAAKSGKSYRLPSEAEWEYACRAGGSDTYCGGNDVEALAWYDKNSDSKTHPVAQKRANAFGLNDMSGNVWEWTQDCYNANYDGAPTDGSAWLGGDCSRRVLRGGSWYDDPQIVRAAERNGSSLANRGNDSGFRLARMLP